jgi:hypothetical protein
MEGTRRLVVLRKGGRILAVYQIAGNFDPAKENLVNFISATQRRSASVELHRTGDDLPAPPFA